MRPKRIWRARDAEPVPASLSGACQDSSAAGNIPEATAGRCPWSMPATIFSSWLAAATLIQTATSWKIEKPRRRARVAIIGSFTTLQLSSILPLAALRQGIELQVWEAPFGQYRQELLDPASALYRGQPDFIVLAVHEGELPLPFLSERPEDEVAKEIARWKGLWQAATLHSSARAIQFNFALPAEAPLGHLGARFPDHATR